MATVVDRDAVHVTHQQVVDARSNIPRSPEGVSPVLGVQDGKGRFVPLPDSLQPLVRRVVNAVASGRQITVGVLPEEVTTTLAAEMLGISRPTLMKRIREGEIPAHKVGTHTRLLTKDVENALEREADRRHRRLLELMAAEDDAGLVD